MTLPSTNIMAPWLSFAEEELGQKEGTPRIVEYHLSLGLKVTPETMTRWCGLFAGYCIKKSGLLPPNGFPMARSWLEWGSGITVPAFGAITVLKRGENQTDGHVGFLIALNDNHLTLLGGNQNNSVSIANFPKDKLLGYRWI